MAITNATRLADFGSGIGTQGAVIHVDNEEKRVGIGTTNPQSMFQVGTSVSMYGNTGHVYATAFIGDGSGLEGVSGGGIGTAISSTNDAGSLIYTTARQDLVAAGTSLSVESGTGGGGMAYTKLAVIEVGAGATFHVGSGTTLKMNVLNVF